MKCEMKNISNVPRCSITGTSDTDLIFLSASQSTSEDMIKFPEDKILTETCVIECSKMG